MIVVDASVVVNAVADDDRDGDRARRRLADDADLHAPHLVGVEVLSVLRRKVALGDVDDLRARVASDDLAAVRVKRYAHEPLLARAWELRANVTAYDAVYGALAETLGCVLVTADERLGRAPGPRCPVEVLA